MRARLSRCHACAAAASHTMRAPPRRDVRKLVRKLGVGARPTEVKDALRAISTLVIHLDPDCLSAVLDAGAIPHLVSLLGHSQADVQQLASGTLGVLLAFAESTGWSTGAAHAADTIPILVQLLGAGSLPIVHEHASGIFAGLAKNANCAAAIAAAGGACLALSGGLSG
jgi:hypothetical protein